jgi:hypothetical protein
MPGIVRFIVTLLGLSWVVACTRSEAPAPADAFAPTQAYVDDFVLRETGDPALAGKLGADARKAWSGVLGELRKGRNARDAAAALTGQGLNVVVLPAGTRRFELPGRTVSVLLMDFDDGCTEIVHERWVSAETEGPARLALVGIGRQDVDDRPTTEKKLHLMAFELPAAGDYAELRTESWSPFGKIVVAFGAVIGLTGCKDEETPTPAPLVADFEPDPNTTATADRGYVAGQVIKDGFWDTSRMSIDYREQSTRVWTSVTRSIDAVAQTREAGVPGNTVQVWLTNTDRVKIVGIRPMGAIDKDGGRATARTDQDGKVHVEIERYGVAGADTARLWGRDPAHDATRSVEITMPQT